MGDRDAGKVVYIDGREGVLWVLEALTEQVKAGKITCLVAVGLTNDGAAVDYRAGTLSSADQLIGALTRYTVRLAGDVDRQTRALADDPA